MDTQNVVYTYSEILFSHKKELYFYCDIYYMKTCLVKADTEGHTLYDVIYMRYLE